MAEHVNAQNIKHASTQHVQITAIEPASDAHTATNSNGNACCISTTQARMDLARFAGLLSSIPYETCSSSYGLNNCIPTCFPSQVQRIPPQRMCDEDFFMGLLKWRKTHSRPAAVGPRKDRQSVDISSDVLCPLHTTRHSRHPQHMRQMLFRNP